MITLHFARRTVLAICLSFFAASAFAQTVAPSQTKPKPYEPTSGQEGKDVVWVPTPEVTVKAMLDLAKVTPQDFVMDLGSGDGRTVIAAAKRGARAMGVEFNPDMVQYSQKKLADAGVTGKATIVQGDLFKTDLSKATVLTMFLLPRINLELRPKILELKPGTRVVSNSFTMDDWEADETVTVEENCSTWCTALLWIVPAKAEGTWSSPKGDIVLKQNFQMLSGTFQGKPITEGRLRGNDMTLTVGGAKVTAKVNGNTLQGTGWTATKK